VEREGFGGVDLRELAQCCRMSKAAATEKSNRAPITSTRQDFAEPTLFSIRHPRPLLLDAFTSTAMAVKRKTEYLAGTVPQKKSRTGIFAL
jgi:hypothetical protein